MEVVGCCLFLFFFFFVLQVVRQDLRVTSTDVVWKWKHVGVMADVSQRAAEQLFLCRVSALS